MPRQNCNSMAVFAVTVCSVFTKEHTDLLKALYLLAFSTYEGFINIKNDKV